MKQPSPIRDWEKCYQEEEVESMPWFHPDLDQDLERALKTLSIHSGAALDLGTGPGTQAIALARKGFIVTASDISRTAVKKARSRSREAGVKIRFIEDDIVSTSLEGPFDLIFDRGCFHTLAPEQRGIYTETVYNLLKAGGYLFVKCFSHREPGEEGPFRFTPDEIRALFESRFVVHSIEDSIFLGTRRPLPQALFSILQKPAARRG